MYDKRGNRRQWWTRETMETFAERAECFVHQYNNYSLTVLGNRVKVLCDDDALLKVSLNDSARGLCGRCVPFIFFHFLSF